jgi:hypothetical protein
MRCNLKMAVCLGLVALFSGCSSSDRQADRAQERAFEAQERSFEAQECAFDVQVGVAQQRLNLVEKYQKCVGSAGGDPMKAAACESYLKAAEALR